mgnify:CR=1 FL=1
MEDPVGSPQASLDPFEVEFVLSSENLQRLEAQLVKSTRIGGEKLVARPLEVGVLVWLAHVALTAEQLQLDHGVGVTLGPGGALLCLFGAGRSAQ